MRVTPVHPREFRGLNGTRWAVVNYTSDLLIVLCTTKEYAELFLREYVNEHGTVPWDIIEVNVE